MDISSHCCQPVPWHNDCGTQLGTTQKSWVHIAGLHWAPHVPSPLCPVSVERQACTFEVARST